MRTLLITGLSWPYYFVMTEPFKENPPRLRLALKYVCVNGTASYIWIHHDTKIIL